MTYVYVLYSQTIDDLYYGVTHDLKRRLREHNNGGEKYTSRADDWKFVYIEGYRAESDAKDRERKLKGYGAAYGHLKNRIEDSIDKLK
ncbi:MAG: endonuclease [Bacteroidetes bacterium QH_9_67_14]|nr:MAG: endonuclease [Bacteroidetes bacterium QH_9_67_14]